jgi:N-acetylmuramoyl-L-alanine amidase
MVGWLPQYFATLLPATTPLPSALTGSISVIGNDSEDIVRMAVSQKVPYLSEQLTDPPAIAVTLFGASSNTNWITHHLSAEGIKQVACRQSGTDQYTLTIYLNYAQQWGYNISYENGSMKIAIRRPPMLADTTAPLKGLIIGIDAGHGGTNQGAIGSTGIYEKVVTLAIANALKDSLQAIGAATVMTRDADSSVGMLDRDDTLLHAGARILVSIHCNSIGETSDAEMIKGTSTYYRYPGFKTLADIMYAKMLQLGLGEWGVTGNFNFSLSGPTQFPNVLVETAFLSNPEDEMKLLDPVFRGKIAGTIVDGLREFVQRYGEKRENK